jgi:serine protease Do
MRLARSHLPMILFACSLLLGWFCSVEANIDAKFIGKNYSTGVVKIILYDDDLVTTFKLKDEEGELSRASGFIVTPGGIIFTNRHVIEWCVFGYMIADWVDDNGVKHDVDVLTYSPGLENKQMIKKVYYVGHATPFIQVYRDVNDTKYDIYAAEVLTLSESFDGAMLRLVSDLNSKPINRAFNPLPIGNSNLIAMGEDLIVLGYPAEYVESDMSLDLRDSLTMSVGKHSGWDYVFDEDNGLIKTVASIHEGNSGGPVFGEENKVIGIATALGLQTQIGLVGGINSMYWVAEPEKAIFQELVKAGLTKPLKDIGKGKTVSGKPRPIPDIHAVRPTFQKRQSKTKTATASPDSDKHWRHNH